MCTIKGHPEPTDGGDDRKTAERELEEETGLKVTEYLLDEQHFDLQYQYENRTAIVKKTVRFFVALVGEKGKTEMVVDSREILGYKWVNVRDAERAFTHSNEAEFFANVRSRLAL